MYVCVCARACNLKAAGDPFDPDLDETRPQLRHHAREQGNHLQNTHTHRPQTPSLTGVQLYLGGNLNAINAAAQETSCEGVMRFMVNNGRKATDTPNACIFFGGGSSIRVGSEARTVISSHPALFKFKLCFGDQVRVGARHHERFGRREGGAHRAPLDRPRPGPGPGPSRAQKLPLLPRLAPGGPVRGWRHPSQRRGSGVQQERGEAGGQLQVRVDGALKGSERGENRARRGSGRGRAGSGGGGAERYGGKGRRRSDPLVRWQPRAKA